MELDIKYYVDFTRLFVDLYVLHETELMQYRAVNEVYMNIINFYEKHSKDFEILSDECQINDEEIVFVFAYDFDDANESCMQNSTADYTIIFNNNTNTFINCIYEQG